MTRKSDLRLTPESVRGAPVLEGLLGKAQLHASAERMVLAAIPPALATGVRFVSCHDGELILSAETGVIASQLRYRQHEIMTALREEELFRFVWKLKVKVAPPRFRQQQDRPKPTLSNENARLLKEEAGHTKDKDLREILEKIASHGGP